MMENVDHWLFPILVKLQVIYQVRRPLDLHIRNALHVSQLEDFLELHRVGNDELVLKLVGNCGLQISLLPSNG